jgi:hypothetical protein
MMPVTLSSLIDMAPTTLITANFINSKPSLDGRNFFKVGWLKNGASYKKPSLPDIIPL